MYTTIILQFLNKIYKILYKTMHVANQLLFKALIILGKKLFKNLSVLHFKRVNWLEFLKLYTCSFSLITSKKREMGLINA